MGRTKLFKFDSSCLVGGYKEVLRPLNDGQLHDRSARLESATEGSNGSILEMFV